MKLDNKPMYVYICIRYVLGMSMTSFYRIGEGHVPRLPALMRHSLSFAFGRRERLQRRPPLTLYISSICFQRSSCYAYNHGSRYTIRVFANKH